jgi:ABC-type amino acid transport substrate-binding protein
VVGEEFAPFEFIDRNGKAVGIDIDIATYIFGKMGIKFEVQLHSWSRAWLMAETGEADAILSTSRKDKR